MKAVAQLVDPGQILSRSAVEDLAELTKARLTSLVLLTTFIGQVMGSGTNVNYLLLANNLIGTALVAAGAAALNQVWEWKRDARMRRTQDRPVPAGRISRLTALRWGVIGAALGLVYLVLTVNWQTALLGGLCLGIYLLAYTPLKPVTPLNTLVGAVAGALPPLMGWAAVRPGFLGAGWCLFFIQYFWQLPHFLALAWLHREDYARAGFVMWPVVDPSGVRTSRQVVGHTVGLVLASLAPVFFGLAGRAYGVAALGLGIGFLGLALRFARQPSSVHARRLFIYSLVYLPLLLTFLVLDRA